MLDSSSRLSAIRFHFSNHPSIPTTKATDNWPSPAILPSCACVSSLSFLFFSRSSW